MTTPNVPLLRKTLEHIIAHPGEWDQGEWFIDYNEMVHHYGGVESLPGMIREIWDAHAAQGNACGTAACFAGHAIQLAGNTITTHRSSLNGIRGADIDIDESIPECAQRLLGLDDRQAYDLFAASNGLETLKRHVRDITDGEVDL